MKCSACSNPAVYSQKYNGRNLCKEHFVDLFEQLVKDTLFNINFVNERDRIAVALSGGKDSVSLLYVLHKILANKGIEIIAITVDEGIKGYREGTMKCARKICDTLEIDQEIVSYQEYFGFDLDRAVKEGIKPCSVCGVLRKKTLNMAAKRLGATKVATGHNLDDEVQSIMMNYLKGDMQRLIRLRPKHHRPGLVPRIKPLQRIPEKEVAIYSMIMEIFEESVECPYASQSLRSDIKIMMNRLEDQLPGIKHRTQYGHERLVELYGQRYPRINLSSCRICGEPCVGDACKACEISARIINRSSEIPGS